jgi:hypothetical protein
MAPRPRRNRPDASRPPQAAGPIPSSSPRVEPNLLEVPAAVAELPLALGSRPREHAHRSDRSLGSAVRAAPRGGHVSRGPESPAPPRADRGRTVCSDSAGRRDQRLWRARPAWRASPPRAHRQAPAAYDRCAAGPLLRRPGLAKDVQLYRRGPTVSGPRVLLARVGVVCLSSERADGTAQPGPGERGAGRVQDRLR